ncbi:hypothetical protein CMI47_06485 [Candidatus Pacearchaeota archaeon]|jgi:hypothetical protein|nr:hypothetical protein [Candidatus Pacearchaeota archaeon]
MLNTFMLMLALTLNPAAAHSKSTKSTKSKKSHYHKTHVRSVPRVKVVTHYPRTIHSGHVWVWKWQPAHEDKHGHHIRGKWVWTLK